MQLSKEHFKTEYSFRKKKKEIKKHLRKTVFFALWRNLQLFFFGLF